MSVWHKASEELPELNDRGCSEKCIVITYSELKEPIIEKVFLYYDLWRSYDIGRYLSNVDYWAYESDVAKEAIEACK